MKITVTGGLGFLGRWLLAEAGDQHQFTLLTRQPAAPRFEFLGQVAEVRQTDYSIAHLTSLLQGMQAIVHLAAVRPAHELPLEAYHFNQTSTASLLQACLKADVANVVLVSSRAVYGQLNPCPWTEKQIPLPDSPYGASKLAMERLADRFLAERGLSSRCLRLAQLAGLGERPGYALTTFIEAARQHQPLQVHASGADGREYLYVRDAARAILAALDRPEVSGAFNIGPQSPISILALARLVNRVFENDGNLEIDPLAADSGEMWWMNCAKARQLLSWSPAWSLEQGLQEIRQLLPHL